MTAITEDDKIQTKRARDRQWYRLLDNKTYFVLEYLHSMDLIELEIHNVNHRLLIVDDDDAGDDENQSFFKRIIFHNTVHSY